MEVARALKYAGGLYVSNRPNARVRGAGLIHAIFVVWKYDSHDHYLREQEEKAAARGAPHAYAYRTPINCAARALITPKSI